MNGNDKAFCLALRIVWIVLAWLAGVLSCLVLTLANPFGEPGVEPPMVRVDTVRDTVFHPEPYAVRDTLIKWVPVERHDTVSNTVPYVIHDSIYIPVSQKEYTDDSTYRAWVSGYNVSLDSIETYRRTVVVTRRDDARAVSVGVGVGYGIVTQKPDVWVGVTLDVWHLFGGGKKKKKQHDSL